MNQEEFAYRIRQALDEGTQHIDYTVSLRLEKARQMALSRQAKEAPSRIPVLRLATGHAGAELGTESPLGAWMMRLGLVAPLLALAIGVVGNKQWQSERMVAELADTDLAILLDDTPIETYAHQGFGVYLRDEGNN